MLITTEEFRKLIVKLYLRASGGGLPKKQKDQHTILKSVQVILREKEKYSHVELNNVLKNWVTGIGSRIGTDHPTVRRMLIDNGYMTRTDGGKVYTISKSNHGEFEFDEEIDEMDVEKIIEEAKEEMKHKAEQFKHK